LPGQCSAGLKYGCKKTKKKSLEGSEWSKKVSTEGNRGNKYRETHKSQVDYEVIQIYYS
jgi:hypothetical protein